MCVCENTILFLSVVSSFSIIIPSLWLLIIIIIITKAGSDTNLSPCGMHLYSCTYRVFS